MSNVTIYNGTCISKPTKATKNKPAVDGRPYSMLFVKPSEMPSEWLGQRVKGTGKSPILPEGMELVWSLTHDAFRVFNFSTSTFLETLPTPAESVDSVGATHRQLVESTDILKMLYRPDLCEQQPEQQSA